MRSTSSGVHWGHRLGEVRQSTLATVNDQPVMTCKGSTQNVPGVPYNEALKLSARFARRSLTPVRYAARRSHWEWRFQLVRSSGVRPPLPSKRILSGMGELRRRGGGGNLGVRRTLPVRSGLLGSAVAGF
jgi:hypothetical protein